MTIAEWIQQARQQNYLRAHDIIELAEIIEKELNRGNRSEKEEKATSEAGPCDPPEPESLESR